MKVLLIGNDINNATGSYSWSSLLKDLIVYARLQEEPRMEGKPFPLLYEEIFLNSSRQHGTREMKMKKYLATQARQLQPNSLHEKILELGIATLLTTNYDITLEAASKHSQPLHNAAGVKENLYSLYRVHACSAHRIWHIHGSVINPASITLGYEHYSGYLQQMRNYTVSSARRNLNDSLMARLRTGKETHESWVDYFFTHDVHILGLNLDFVEIHLWWLLTFRARARLLNKLKIKNTIWYYYPHAYEARARHKLELLRANEVQTVPLTMKGTNRMGYYERVLRKIKAG